jgi:hypothetical protein
MNPLTNWFLSTGKFTNKESTSITHLLLDGGILDITNDYETFQILYAKYINFKNCIVEKKTEFFKFFIDFDILTEKIIDESDYIKCIQDVIYEIYKIKDLKCIVATSDKFLKTFKNDKEYYKQGFHFHWPEIVVDNVTALDIRSNIVTSLVTIFGKIEYFNDPWEKIVDECVYKKNGLRLIGSDKCNMADGKKQYENRVYILKSVYMGTQDSKELFEYYSNDILELVKDTSIRTNFNAVTPYINLNHIEEIDNTEKISSFFTNIPKDDPINIEIKKFFKIHSNGYRVEDIGNVLLSKDKPMIIINTKSKFCQNKGDFHKNNHIYFKLTPSGLCQRCLSQNMGEHGCCRDYQSSYVPISQSLLSVLNWKKPNKNKEVDIQKNFSLNSLLETIENRITAKHSFTGPPCKKKCI